MRDDIEQINVEVKNLSQQVNKLDSQQVQSTEKFIEFLKNSVNGVSNIKDKK